MCSSDSKVRVYSLETFDLVDIYTGCDKNAAASLTSSAINSESKTADGHSNRLFAIKIDRENPNVFYTGGWDRNVKIWDRRLASGLVSTLYGNMNICADGIDVKVDLFAVMLLHLDRPK
jgi:WD40 repeat protein